MHGIKLQRHKYRPKKLLEIKDLYAVSRKLKADNKRIIFTLGTFDMLNPGHCRFLAEAKSLGDILVVGVTTNFSETSLKGADYPLVDQDIRAELVCFIKSVDYVIPVDEKNPYDVLLLLRPNIFFTSATSWESGIRTKHDRDIVKTFRGKITKLKDVPPYFTSASLAEHVANIRVIKILETYLTQKIKDFNLNPTEDLKPADFGLQLPSYKKSFDANKLILTQDLLATFRETFSVNKKKVVFVSGSYDLLHVGHARFIEQAGLLGDILVVGIPADSALRRIKGVGRPIISERSRAYVLGHLDPVDYVVIFESTTVYDTLATLKPDIFFTVDEEWNKGYKESPEYKLVTSYGGKVVRAPRQAPFLSSSVLIDKLAQKKVREIFSVCLDDPRINNLSSERTRLAKVSK